MSFSKIFNRDSVNRAFEMDPQAEFVSDMFRGDGVDDAYWHIRAKREDDGTISLSVYEFVMQAIAGTDHAKGLSFAEALVEMDKWECAQAAQGRHVCTQRTDRYPYFRDLAERAGAVIGHEEVSRVHTNLLKSTATRKRRQPRC